MSTPENEQKSIHDEHEAWRALCEGMSPRFQIFVLCDCVLYTLALTYKRFGHWDGVEALMAHYLSIVQKVRRTSQAHDLALAMSSLQGAIHEDLNEAKSINNTKFDRVAFLAGFYIERGIVFQEGYHVEDFFTSELLEATQFALGKHDQPTLWSWLVKRVSWLRETYTWAGERMFFLLDEGRLDTPEEVALEIPLLREQVTCPLCLSGVEPQRTTNVSGFAICTLCHQGNLPHRIHLRQGWGYQFKDWFVEGTYEDYHYLEVYLFFPFPLPFPFLARRKSLWRKIFSGIQVGDPLFDKLVHIQSKAPEKAKLWLQDERAQSLLMDFVGNFSYVKGSDNALYCKHRSGTYTNPQEMFLMMALLGYTIEQFIIHGTARKKSRIPP